MISAPARPPEAPPAPDPQPLLSAAPPLRNAGRRSGGRLGLVWIHGHFDAAVCQRHQVVRSWSSPDPVATLEEFARALTAALEALAFDGVEAFLVLEHDEFVHQSEVAPAFSDDAAHAYLKGRVQRHEREHGRVVWVGEKTHTARQDSAFILHLLPCAFYDRLNQILLSRRLDLTRLVPLAVPLQRVLDGLPTPPLEPVLLAAEAGAGTIILVGRPAGELVFARIIRASCREEPARVGSEINRSLLYAKQQFGIAVDHVWLAGGDQIAAEVEARCAAVKQIDTRELKPGDWLQAILRLRADHPVNLVAGYLRRKRRQQLVRRAAAAACWLALALVALDYSAARASRRAEQSRFDQLRAGAAALQAEHDRLAQRNLQLAQDLALVQHWSDGRLPAVPSRFLRYLATLLSPDTRLTNFAVTSEGAGAGWTFHLEGTVEGDEEAGGDAVTALEQRLSQSPLHVRLNASARVVTPLPSAANAPAQRFTLEGGLLEN